MKIELGQMGEKNYDYRLRIGEKGLPFFAFTRRPAGVDKLPVKQPPRTVKPDIKPVFPELLELGTLDTENYLYRLRWKDSKGHLTKPYLTRRKATQPEITAVEQKWQRLKKAASDAVVDTVKGVFTPSWTKGLVAFNTVAFLASQFNPELVEKLTYTPASLLFHADWKHLISNTIPLLILGREAEKSVGGKAMLLSYILGGMAGSAAHIFKPIQIKEYGVTLPVQTIGASGAVMGLYGLSLINAVKERALGKAALLTAGAHLILNYNHGPLVDQLGHAIGFATGLIGGLFHKPTPQQIKEGRRIQMPNAPLAAHA